METMDSRPRLLVTVNNHFDPTWRRCWDRRFEFRGDIYVSYADLETYYMLDNLELARQYPTTKFEAESAIVARKFLERHPEALEDLQALAKEGRFAVTGGGEAIIDGNMVLGESLVRNLVSGLLWVEETFGQRTRLAVRNDAFGNSAQLPQILRGCEIAWMTGASYSLAEGVYWRGLDGSTIVHATLPIAARGGGNTKYAPCSQCRGAGVIKGEACAPCGGRGIEMSERSWLPGEIDPHSYDRFGAALVSVAPEELLPNPDLVAWVERMPAQLNAGFALEEEALPYIQPWLDQVDAAPEALIHPAAELNPNNAGCWVTRIQTKQQVRQLEHALLAAETLATMAAFAGQTYPKTELDSAWRQLFFAEFHDAITATHVDPAYVELRDVWANLAAHIDGVRWGACTRLTAAEPGAISVVNTTGHAMTEIATVTVPAMPDTVTLEDAEGRCIAPTATHRDAEGGLTIRFVARDVPPMESRPYRLRPGGGDAPTVAMLGRPRIENERFLIEGDGQGLSRIFDKTLGWEVLTAAEYRPGEFILEHDEGSPWATLHPDQSRTRLAPHTRLLAAEAGPGWQRLRYEVSTPREMGLSGHALLAEVLVTLTEGIERVDFRAQAHWDAFNHRLRVAFPVPFEGRHFYEIPYGMVERHPYSPSFGWAGANGDWPAVGWAGIEGRDASVAVLNKGTPSYRIEPDGQGGSTLLLSLLRSPAIPTYLHEPEFYTMTDWDGMRDAGQHSFEYALVAYGSEFADSPIVLDADGYNAGLLTVEGRLVTPSMPTLTSRIARLTSIKRTERSEGWAVRLVEYRGVGGEATLKLPPQIQRALRTNLLEREAAPLALTAGEVHLYLRPWEIVTVVLE